MQESGHIAGRLGELLRDHPMINDAEVMDGPDPAEFTVLVVPQGFQPGPAVRELVMRLAGSAGERARVALTPAIPRDGAGRLDIAQATVVASQPDLVLRFVPASTEAERSVADLVREVLTDVRVVSMTDSLTSLGCDSVSAVEIVVRIRERFGQDLDPHTVFGTGSLRELAALLGGDPARTVP